MQIILIKTKLNSISQFQWVAGKKNNETKQNLKRDNTKIPIHMCVLFICECFVISVCTNRKLAKVKSANWKYITLIEKQKQKKKNEKKSAERRETIIIITTHSAWQLEYETGCVLFNQNWK